MSFWNRAVGLRRHRSDRAKQQQRKRRQSRRMLLEALEPRQMMTGVPEIAVWHQQDDDYGGSAWTELYDGAGNVSFDDTAAGTPVSKTFSVQNMGDAPLTLDLQSLVLPSGFSLLAPPDASVAPCNSTSFTIQFDATAAGSFSGYFSIGNDDSDENPFDIYLSALAQDDDYGGDAYGGDAYGGGGYGGDSYGGDSYGGDSYGGDGTVAPDDPPIFGVPDVEMPNGPDEVLVDLRWYFDDVEDGSGLSYTIIANSNPAIFDSAPSIDDGYLTLRAASAAVGKSTVTVRATDSQGLTVDSTFTVSTTLPKLSIIDKKNTGETAAPAFLVLKRSGGVAQQLDVDYVLSGSATIGEDFLLNANAPSAPSSSATSLPPRQAASHSLLAKAR